MTGPTRAWGDKPQRIQPFEAEEVEKSWGEIVKRVGQGYVAFLGYKVFLTDGAPQLRGYPISLECHSCFTTIAGDHIK